MSYNNHLTTNNNTSTTTTTTTTTNNKYIITPDESALSRKRRCQVISIITGIPIIDEISPQVLEIISPQGGGKTELLLSITRKCIVAGMIVAYLDMDCHLTQHRLQQIFIGENDEIQSRMLISKPSNGQELLQAIHLSIHKKCRVIMIDSLLSVHWLFSLTEPVSAGLSVSFPSMLYRLRQQHGIVIIATKTITSTYKNDLGFISKTWSNGVTHRLYLKDNTSTNNTNDDTMRFTTVKDGVDITEEFISSVVVVGNDSTVT
jgi:hypothetical protein